MSKIKLPVGPPMLLLGLVVGLLGSLADNALGGAGAVTALQVVLWIAGGLMILTGAASSVTMRAGQKARRAPLRPTTR